MREKIAQAMANRYPSGFDASGADRARVVVEFTRELTDIALTALLVPTEEIVAAGAAHIIGTDSRTGLSLPLGRGEAEEIFTTMIRAAKEEPQQ